MSTLSGGHAPPVMRALAVREFGAPLEMIELPVPRPAADEVLVSLWAAAVNPFDWTIAQGWVAARAPHVFPLVLGVDGAGVVEQVGEDASRFAVGDSVYGVFLHSPYGKGTYAQYIAVPEWALIAPAPNGVSLHRAAAVPTAGISALALVRLASIGHAQHVLIVGAGGGIGSFAIQLAAARGARVIASSRPQCFARLEALGASVCIDYLDGDVGGQLARIAPRGVDALLDLASDTESFTANLAYLREGGHAISTRYAANADALAGDSIDVVNLDLPGRHGSIALLEALTAEIDAGRLRVDVQEQILLEDALGVLEQNGGRPGHGKTIIRIRP
jgi:NADPH2:quinone reductase